MTDNDVKLSISVVGVDSAEAQFDRLTKAIERATAALRDLADVGHGGIEVQAVGEIMNVVIKPMAAH